MKTSIKKQILAAAIISVLSLCMLSGCGGCLSCSTCGKNGCFTCSACGGCIECSTCQSCAKCDTCSNLGCIIPEVSHIYTTKYYDSCNGRIICTEDGDGIWTLRLFDQECGSCGGN